MGSRALGELLLRPSTLVRGTPARLTPAWPARHISSTPSRAADKPPPSAAPFPAPTPAAVAPSPRPAPPSTSNAAIDSFFAAPAAAPAASPQTSRVFGENFSTPGRRARNAPPGLHFDDMNMDGILNPSAANKAPDTTLADQQKRTFENYPRLEPEYGRTVHLDPARGRDIVRGIGMMASMMVRNQVRPDFMKQRFHERPGLKRKRLNSQRWRARFKKGFRSVTGRVMELTRKGW